MAIIIAGMFETAERAEGAVSALCSAGVPAVLLSDLIAESDLEMVAAAVAESGQVVLEVRGLVEALIVVDTEGQGRPGDAGRRA